MLESLLNKVGGQPATLLKKRLRRKCFSVNFGKYLITPVLQNTSRRLPLLRVWFSFDIFITFLGTHLILHFDQ